MTDRDEIERFHDRASNLMRELLSGLARCPSRPRAFFVIEDELGWPRRRIASVLGGAGRMRIVEFGGRRPYRFHDAQMSSSGRWELWSDADQAAAIRAATGPADADIGSRR